MLSVQLSVCLIGTQLLRAIKLRFLLLFMYFKDHICDVGTQWDISCSVFKLS